MRLSESILKNIKEEYDNESYTKEDLDYVIGLVDDAYNIQGLPDDGSVYEEVKRALKNNEELKDNDYVVWDAMSWVIDSDFGRNEKENIKESVGTDAIEEVIKRINEDGEDADIYDLLEEYDIDTYELIERLRNLTHNDPEKNKEATDFIEMIDSAESIDDMLEDKDEYNDITFIYWIKELEGK